MTIFYNNFIVLQYHLTFKIYILTSTENSENPFNDTEKDFHRLNSAIASAKHDIQGAG